MDRGTTRCPFCGKEIPIDCRFCIYCGSYVEPFIRPKNRVQQTEPPKPIVDVQGASVRLEYELMDREYPLRESIELMNIAYELVFPDGKKIVVLGEQVKVFGREDFVNYIPEHYLIYITRRAKGGQFIIACRSTNLEDIQCFIRDDNSSNGTLVNGRDIKGIGWVPLRDGDIISPAGVINIVFKMRRRPRIDRGRTV